MRKKFKIAVAFILVLTMVVGMGLSSYMAEEPTDSVVPVDTEEPIDPEPPAEPPFDPVDSTDPTDPVDPVVPTEPVPTDPVVPETPKVLSYTVIYFIDEEEALELQIDDFVTFENPVVETVPDNMPVGYMVDEEMSTELPFTVTEENNTIIIYYIQKPKSLTMSSFMLMGLATPGEYDSEDGVVVKNILEGQSTNTHTLPALIWSNGATVYAAVKSTHYLKYMTLEGITSTVFDEYNPWISIFVDGDKYTPDYLNGNTKDAHWTVFRFNLTDLPIPVEGGNLDFFIKGIGTGHDVGGYMTVIIPKIDVTGYKEWVGGEDWPSVILQLRRQLEFGPIEIVAEGTVDGEIDPNENPPWSYTWFQMLKSNPYGQLYIYSIDEIQVPMNYEKTIDGMTVTNTYTPPGELTITKYVSGDGYDSDQEFDIFVYGSNGKTYVVTLKDGETVTLYNLGYATYTIEEIVPMNYILKSISDNQITLDRFNNIASVEVYNEPTNDGWFYDDDERINSFRVGVTTTRSKDNNNLGYYYFVNETIVPEEIIYKKRVFV